MIHNNQALREKVIQTVIIVNVLLMVLLYISTQV